MEESPQKVENHRGDLFGTTHWSLVLSWADSGKDTEKAHEALAQLCRLYWRPIFAYFCRSGRSTADAQDLTQDFFVHLLKGDLFGKADQERGKFRSLLYRALKNFAIDAHAKTTAKKRGAGVAVVSWEDWMAEAPSQLCVPGPAIDSWSAEKVFDYRWAATVAEQALRRLGEECEARGRRRVFDAVSGLLMADRADVAYAPLAARLGIPPEKIKRLLHQMRERFRVLLRDEVGRTMADPSRCG